MDLETTARRWREKQLNSAETQGNEPRNPPNDAELAGVRLSRHRRPHETKTEICSNSMCVQCAFNRDGEGRGGIIKTKYRPDELPRRHRPAKRYQ